MAYVVSPKGQIVIAKEIRDLLGLETGWLAIQRLVDDHVEVYFVPPEHKKSLKGSLAEHIKIKLIRYNNLASMMSVWNKSAI